MEEEMLNQYYVKAKKFADENIKPFAEEIDAKAEFPTEIFDKISAEGFFKLIVPIEFGGEGAGADAQAYVNQAFAEGCATVGLCYTMHNVALKFVLTFGSEELKSFIIDEVVKNGKMLSLARSEFGTGVHVFQSQTQLQYEENNVTVNGIKSMITSANYADYYLISVPPTEDGKMMNWLVPKGTEGLRFAESDWRGIGMRGNNSCPMHMENMKLDKKFGVHICRKTHPQVYPVNIDVIYFMTGLAGVYSGMCQRVKGVIHWVSATLGVPATVRLYEHLLFEDDELTDEHIAKVKADNPTADDDTLWVLTHINPNSVQKLNAIVEPSLAAAKPDEKFQFERESYFVADGAEHTTDKPVFNQIVSLKDGFK